MNLQESQKNWDELAKADPLFIVLTYKDKQGGKWDPKEFFNTGVAEVETDLAYIRSLGTEILKGKALDFGCGVGRLSQALVNQFEEVHGVDISEKMIELARKYNQKGDKCKFYVNAKKDLSLFQSNSFAFIYSKIALQHIRPVFSKAYLQEFMRLLTLGGILFFQLTAEPAKAAPQGALRRFIKKLLPENIREWLRDLKWRGKARVDVYGVPKDEVIKILESNGGQVLGVRPNNIAGEYWLGYDYCAKKVR
jgi:SAM-dependent methyltransferase